jgi:D-alanine transaminase
MQLAMIQDKIVPFEQLDAAYLDRGLYFGDGVYEVIRSYDGRIFAFEEHMQRFTRSLVAIEIKNVDIDDIRSRVKKTFDAAGIPNAKIYFHITRGSGPRSHVCDDNIKPNFFLTVTEIVPNVEKKTKGISVTTVPDLRWKRCDIKSLNLLANVLAQREAAQKGCAEAVLVDEKGLITEGASSAFFAITKKNLQTAPLTANILPSVTRKFVLKAAENAKLSVVEKSLTPEQAQKADELFIAVTTIDIVPVVKFDDVVIGGGKPGQLTRKMMDEFQSFTK